MLQEFEKPIVEFMDKRKNKQQIFLYQKQGSVEMLL